MNPVLPKIASRDDFSDTTSPIQAPPLTPAEAARSVIFLGGGSIFPQARAVEEITAAGFCSCSPCMHVISIHPSSTTTRRLEATL